MNTTTETINYYGITCKITEPQTYRESGRKTRYEVKAYAYLPGIRKSVAFQKVRQYTDEAATAAAKGGLEAMVRDAAEEILAHVRARNWDPLLTAYYWLRKEQIHRNSRHAKYVKSYPEIMADTRMANLTLRTPLLDEQINALFNGKSDKQRRLKKICIFLLDDLYEQAARDTLDCENLFAKDARSRQRSDTENASRVMNRHSLGQSEYIAIVGHLLSLVSGGNLIAAAQLLQLLVAIKRDELCGLDAANWIRCKDYGISWIVIEKIYYQTRGRPPELRYKLNHIAQYRCIPCTPLMEWILATVCLYRSGRDSALFLMDGNRLAPETLRLATDPLLDEFIEHGGALALDVRKKFGQKDDRQISSGNIPRSTLDYNMRNTIHMPFSWKEILLGRGSQLETYAGNYVNWSDPGVLQILGDQLNHLHMLTLASVNAGISSFPTTQISGYNHIVRCPEHARIFVNSKHGATVVAQRIGGQSNEKREKT